MRQESTQHLAGIIIRYEALPTRENKDLPLTVAQDRNFHPMHCARLTTRIREGMPNALAATYFSYLKAQCGTLASAYAGRLSFLLAS